MQHLLVIDPQNDFCDLPAELHAPQQAPSLPVRGAHADLQRLARWLDRVGAEIDAITVTLDSHHQLDVAHPGFWRTADGGEVAPFTAITAAELREGRFVVREPRHHDRVLHYLDELERRGRYTLMVWPVHCEIGSWGHAVHADLRASYNRWERARMQSVHMVMKGQNPFTEHYSAILAEVPDPEDPATQINRALLDRLAAAETLWVAGEASSHCVRATVLDLCEHLPHPERIVLLTDCMSPVAGFEAAHTEFLAEAQRRGVRLTTSENSTSERSDERTRRSEPEGRVNRSEIFAKAKIP